MATVTVESGIPFQRLTAHNVDWIACEGGEALLGISTDHPWGNVRVYLSSPQDVAILESCGGRRTISIRKRRD